MEHHVMVVGGFQEKLDAAAQLVEANPRSIVFTRTREGATELRDRFGERGIVAVDLHGNLTQRVRERNLHRFTKGDAQVVVATDVAARGIHVDGIGLVVHFDAPADPKAYLHRSGRTARAGESGAVVTLTVRKRLEEVRRLQKQAGVDAKNHDIRTAARPLTAGSLAEAAGATFADDRPRTGGSRRTYDTRTPGRGGNRQRRFDRPAGKRAGSSTHKAGTKARWTSADRRTR
jgi:superfamily II DNA/RNA helicase